MTISVKIPRIFEKIPPKWLYIAVFAMILIAPHECGITICHPSCATCSDSTATGCLTCPPYKWYLPSNHSCVADCPSGYTENYANKTCIVAVTCHPSCATCSNSSATGCLTCPPYKWYIPANHSCVADCPSGYTEDYATKSCVALTCHPSCATCSNSSATGCLTCPPYKWYIPSNHSCVADCPSGYTEDYATKSCVALTCHPSCATCSNSSATGCLTCPPYKWYIPANHSCVADCPSGYTENYANKSCVALTCHPSCATCSNSSANGCLTCPPYKWYIPSNHSCVADCPSGYTEDYATKSCVALTCHPSCATCSNSSATGCLTCPPYKWYIPANHSCVADCPSGYTEDYATKSCVALTCHPSCATCSNSSATGCLTCPPYKWYIPSNHSCVADCPSGYTENYANKTCVVLTCHPSCATCSNSSANGCLTCPPYKWYIPSNHSCVADCPSGYTEDYATKSCVALTCHPSCATCSNSSATGCLTCPPYKWYIPSNHSCVADCPSGYTENYANKSCVALTCHPSCATCSNSSANGCLTCPPYKWYIPANHSCVADCPSGYTENYANKSCVALTCHPSCATCSNSSANGCLTCPPYKWYIPSNHSCVADCPSGYTEDYATKSCVALTCHPSCATCSNSSATGCLTCPPYKWYIPSNHSCVADCPSGYTENYANKTCVVVTCHPSCATCSNSSATGCLTCPPYKWYIPSNHSCVADCPSGYTENYATKTCVVVTCHPSCATCSNSSATGCLTCPPYKWYIPSNRSCVADCPSGYTESYPTKTCVPVTCHPSCATCSNSSATGCLTCPPYKWYIPSNRSCVADCPSGYTENYPTKTCVPVTCHPSCATCSNSSAIGCLTCPPYKWYIPFNHSCVADCPSGYTENYATKTCVPVICHPSCATCSNSSATGCLTCPPYKWYIPSNRSCVADCPSGYTENYPTKTCVPVVCHPSCATCSNSSATGCLTCPPYKWYIPSNRSCVADCPSGYTESYPTKTCVPVICHPSCATCSNSSANGCLTCPPYKWYIPSNRSCVATCPSGYTGDYATKTCVIIPCHPSCATCSNSSATGCLTCPPYKWYIPSNRSCVSTCPSGYTGDYATKTCVVITCHPTCATCSNSSANGCLTCPPYKWYIPSNRSCVAICPSGYTGDYATKTCVPVTCHPSCATCSNSSANGCLTCPWNWYFVPSNHTCVKNCPPAWCGSGNVCVTCHPSCATCDNNTATGCLTCPPYKWLIPSNHTCVDTCPIGYTGDYATKTCVSVTCHPSCATCSNSSATGCLTCPWNRYLIPLNHTCVKNCPKSWFANGNICTPCHSSCATCSNASATGCLSCPKNKYFIAYNHTCVKNCPYAWYPNGNVCTTCHPSCGSCSGSGFDQCNTCTSSYPVQCGNYCQVKCPGRWVQNKWQCYQCHASCNGCVSGARNCVQCARGYTRTNPSGPCIPKSKSRLIRLRD